MQQLFKKKEGKIKKILLENMFFIMQNWKKNLPLTVISGMKNIKKVTINKEKEKNSDKYIYKLFAQGNELK